MEKETNNKELTHYIDKYNDSRHFQEIPAIVISKSKLVESMEVERINLEARSYTMEECLSTIKKLKKLFDV